MDIIDTAAYEERIAHLFTQYHVAGSLTAAAVGKLVSDKERYPKLSWDTPIKDVIPNDFVSSASAVTCTTLEDALSHRSGYPRHDDSYLSGETPQAVTRSLRNLPLSATPRTKFQYNNMMYTVASHVVSEVSREPFDQFLSKYFWQPLGMESTYLQPSAVYAAGPDVASRVAKGYLWSEKKQQLYQFVKPDQPEGTGAGLIQSTVVDYAKWGQAMMNKDPELFSSRTAGGKEEEDKARAIYDDLVYPRMVEEDNEFPFFSYALYGLGWGIETYRGTRIIQHGGSDMGVGSVVFYIPSKNIGAIIFGNGDSRGDMGDFNTILQMELIDEVFGVPKGERVDWLELMKANERKSLAGFQKKKEKLKIELEKEKVGDLTEAQIDMQRYVGTYQHPGYHNFTVEAIQRDGKDVLYLDAKDRGMPFEITFEHVHSGTAFIATKMEENDPDYIRAAFELNIDDEDAGKPGNARRMGLGICEELSPGMIWFERILG